MRKTQTSPVCETLGDDYFDLVRRFPLRPIRNRDQYDQAGEIHYQLVSKADDRDLSDGERDYSDALGRFIRDYDEVHFSLGPKMTPLEALQYIMSETGMKPVDLGRLLGSGSGQASLILNGKRELSKANIRRLAEHFHVSPALFI